MAAIDYETKPGLLVHTSGQACWYNAELLEEFNLWEERFWGRAFEPLAIASYQPPVANDEWQFTTTGTGVLFRGQPPFLVDIVVTGGDADAHVPFQVTGVDPNALTLYAEPIMEQFSGIVSNAAASDLSVKPFYRVIAPRITTAVWEDAADLNGIAVLETNDLAYGHWSPYAPYDSNWYNGAERSLIQYFFDSEGDVWRPSGYAEHYVIRDLLAAIVIEDPSTADAIRFRRNLARWCHRHGLTTVHDIMFYRRRANTNEYYACEALSYDRAQAGETDFFPERGLSTNVPTGRFFLRTGLYYYLENREDIDKVLALADPDDGETDIVGLLPPPGHPEYPGWFKWLGWKLQFDGGTGARTIISNAPYPKTTRREAYTNETEIA